jgi:signal transduction histidine kinase
MGKSADTDKKQCKEFEVIKKIFLIAGIFWTAVLVMLFCITCWSAYTTKIDTVKNSVVDSFNKDTVYRYWATSHGGVYVPVTAETPPNPNLAHIPERDIVTPSGRKLTLVNPAYMTRQVYTLGQKKYGLFGHITSLKPIRAQNAPDDWEREALGAFEKGTSEVSGLTKISGQTYYRFMRPFITEKGCLKCHAQQGYKEGDVRGGISLSVPWSPIRRALVLNITVICLAYVVMLFLGFMGLRYSYNLVIRQMHKRKQNELFLKEINNQQVAVNRMVSQDLKSPLITIRAYAKYLEEDIADGDAGKIEKSLYFISNAADSMFSLVEELQLLLCMEHETHPYVETSLQELVREALELVAGSITQRGVKVEVTDMPVVLYGDCQLLVRVFRNLIDNAVKFMGDQTEPRIEIGVEEEEKNIFIFVRDNGMGIDSSAAHIIFKSSSKLDAPVEGSGQGLVLVKRVVEMHGGAVWVESEGCGCCFRLRLPRKASGFDSCEKERTV